MSLRAFIYRSRGIVLYGMLNAVGICIVMAALGDPSVWLSRAGLVADLTGLLQLEVSGFFGELLSIVLKLDERGEDIPSRYMREVIDLPDEDKTFKGRIDEWLQRSPKAGILLIAIGCSLQLVGTFF